jgi:hypothetical protein
VLDITATLRVTDRFDVVAVRVTDEGRVDSSEMRAKGPEMRLRCLIRNARVRRAYLIGQP